MKDWGYATITATNGRTLVCDRCHAKVRQLHGAPDEDDRLCVECVRDEQDPPPPRDPGEPSGW